MRTYVKLFAILQKYDFSSKSQLERPKGKLSRCCLRYCKSTIFQANHNYNNGRRKKSSVVCDTAKVRFFKQITTKILRCSTMNSLFAILQKYDFSSKSQHYFQSSVAAQCCLRYCKSTIFQANHNYWSLSEFRKSVVCDTAKVRFFKQITTQCSIYWTAMDGKDRPVVVNNHILAIELCKEKSWIIVHEMEWG